MIDQSGHIRYLHFNHTTFSLNPSILQELSVFYCNIWKYDEHFQEFMKCPRCGKYFSETQVLSGTKQCTGESEQHIPTNLIDAWVPASVAEDILQETAQYGDLLYGIIAFDDNTNKIIGFTWGYLEPWQKILDRWGSNIYCDLYSADTDGAFYYSELAVDKKYRNHDIGKQLVYQLVSWVKVNYPNSPAFLRTHAKSTARVLFTRAGYLYFADDPEHGAGRIMMGTSMGHFLTPENLL